MEWHGRQCSTFVPLFRLPIHIISTSTTQRCHRHIFVVHECVPLQVHIDYISRILLSMAVLEQIQGKYAICLRIRVLEYSFETSTHTWVLASQMGTCMDEYELSMSFHFGISQEYSYS